MPRDSPGYSGRARRCPRRQSARPAFASAAWSGLPYRYGTAWTPGRAPRSGGPPRRAVASCGRLSHIKFLAPAASRNSRSFTRELITAVSVAATPAAVSPGVSTAPKRSLAPPQNTYSALGYARPPEAARPRPTCCARLGMMGSPGSTIAGGLEVAVVGALLLLAVDGNLR